MKKRIFLSILILVMLITFSACSNVAEIATVDGETVKEEYFRYYFTELKDMMQNQHGEDAWQDASLDGKPALEYVRECALQKAVDDKIVMMKAIEDGITLTGVDLKNIDVVKQQWIERYGSKDNFLKAINDNYGWDEDDFDYMLATVYYNYHIIDKYVKVDDNEIKSYYENDIVKVKHILIPTIDLSNNMPLSAEEMDEAKKTVELIKEEIANGADFDSLVEKYTKDQNVFYYVGKGYKLDSNGAQASAMVPEFEDAAFSLEVDEIGDVVESVYGYHIIKRYANDDEMYKLAYENLSFIIKSQKFIDIMDGWKKEMNIVINEEIYNTYK